MSKPKTHTLRVHATTANIAAVRDFVASHAEAHGFNTEDIDRIRLAVDEAYTNVIKHAYDFDESQWVSIEVKTDPRTIHVVISDSGRSFNPDGYQEPNIEERIKMRKRGGVGVFLIHKLMDEVEYRKQGSLNEIVLTKHL